MAQKGVCEILPGHVGGDYQGLLSSSLKREGKKNKKKAIRKVFQDVDMESMNYFSASHDEAY